MTCRAKPQNSRKHLLKVKAVEWPDQELLDAVEESFPDAGVADAEEARVSASFSRTMLNIYLRASASGHLECSMTCQILISREPHEILQRSVCSLFPPFSC